MAKALATRSVDLEAIDRLEEKLKMLGRRSSSACAATETQAGGRERPPRRASSTPPCARLTEAEGVGAELATLREERELIESRVDDMLAQIEALNL